MKDPSAQVELLKCSICGDRIYPEANGWDKGHNAQPVNDGRCCTICNATTVLPERLKSLIDRNNKSDALRSE